MPRCARIQPHHESEESLTTEAPLKAFEIHPSDLANAKGAFSSTTFHSGAGAANVP